MSDPGGSGAAGDLRADCARCHALCCVGLTMTRSADFAIDKPAGAPCPNLTGDDRCRIHRRLRDSGFAGCTTYDCFGAGQRLSRSAPTRTPAMLAALPVLRDLHELLILLAEAAAYDTGHRAAVGRLCRDVTAGAALGPAELPGVDVDALRRDAGPLLAAVSRAVRGPAPEPAGPERPGGERPGTEHRGTEHPGTAHPGAEHPGLDYTGADLAGRRLAGADLRAASLRRAVLIGADLSGADLRGADLLGADLRAADLRGADLRGAMFVLDPQFAAATGDASTRLDPRRHRPEHWS